MVLAPAIATATMAHAQAEANAPEAPRSPDWLQGAVAYGVVPPLFGDPPIRSVTAKLDQLQALGVNAIWLSPIQPSDDPSLISYGATDLCGVRPDFGDDEDLRELVRAAHARDIKVLLDITPNHLSSAHPYFQDALAQGQASPYYDYFERQEDGEPAHYFDWDHLINLNYDNPDVQSMVAEAFEYWIDTFGVDGFRVDAAWGPRQRQPAFWSQLNERLSQRYPDLFMLAEASARDPYYLSHGFDAAYDWGDSLGEWAWGDAFSQDEGIAARLSAALSHTSATPPERIARFLNNNDTGERFITRHGPEKTKVAATLLLTLPGLPIIYMGDEVGAEFEPYEDPPPLTWEDPHELLSHYQQLIEWRENLPALAQGDFELIELDGEPDACAYLRKGPEGETVLVVLNFGEGGAVQLPTTELPPGPWQDLLTGETIDLSAGKLDLKEVSSLVLVPARPALPMTEED